jgi:regulatory protein
MDQPVITAIVPTQRNPQRATIRVGRQAMATLSRRLIDELGLMIGQAWNDAIAQQVSRAAQVDKATRQGLNRLNRRPMSSGRMRTKLRQLGYDEAVIVAAIDRLTQLGALDDEAMGRALVEELVRRGSGGPRLIRARLQARGIPVPLAQGLAAEADNAEQQVDAARVLARKRLRMMARLEPAIRQRRLWAALARRGFDHDIITAALNGLEGLNGRPDDDG